MKRTKAREESSVLELITSWSDTVLDVRQLSDDQPSAAQTFTVGEDPACDLWISRDDADGAQRMPVVQVSSRSVMIRVPRAGTVSVSHDGGEVERYSGEAIARADGTPPGSVPGTLFLPLQPGWTATLSVGRIVFFARPVQPETLTLPRRPLEKVWTSSLSSSALFHGLLLILAFLTPQGPERVSLDELAESNRFVRYIIVPPPDLLPPPPSAAELRARAEDRRRRAAERTLKVRQDAARYGAFSLIASPDRRDLARRRHRRQGSAGRDRAALLMYPGRRRAEPVWAAPQGAGQEIGNSLDASVQSRLAELVNGTPAPPPHVLGATPERRERRQGSRAPLGFFTPLDASNLGLDGRGLQLDLLVLAPQLASSGERPTLDLRLVIDRSQSMTRDEARWQRAIAAAHAIVDRLGPDDRLSVISYAGDARFDLPTAPMRSQLGVHEILDELQPGGLSAPLEAGRLVNSSWPRRRSHNDVGVVVMIGADDNDGWES